MRPLSLKTAARIFLAKKKSEDLGTAAGDAAPEGCDLILPLLAESQHQNLLIDMRILAETAHRAAARIGEHLKSRARLLVELRQRRDFQIGRAHV